MKQTDDHQVIKLIPSARTYYVRAMIAYKKNDLKKAERHFRTGVSLASNEEEEVFGNVQLSLIYQHSFQFEKSIAVLNDILENETEQYHDIYFFQATNYIHLEDYETAKALLDVYREGRPDGAYSAKAEEMNQMIEQQLSKKGY